LLLRKTPGLRVGALWHFQKSDVEKWIEKKEKARP